MPQPQTPRYPRCGSRSLATWLNTYANTGLHRRNAGCPGTRTRNELSNMAPPTCKNTRTNFEVCTDPVRDKHQHTASSTTSTTATRRSQPPSRRQNKPGPRQGLVLRGQASRPARPNDRNRSRKRRQCCHRWNHSRSVSPRRAHSSRWRSVTPCIWNGQTAQKYKAYSGQRSKDNQSNSYGFGAR